MELMPADLSEAVSLDDPSPRIPARRLDSLRRGTYAAEAAASIWRGIHAALRLLVMPLMQVVKHSRNKHRTSVCGPNFISIVLGADYAQRTGGLGQRWDAMMAECEKQTQPRISRGEQRDQKRK